MPDTLSLLGVPPILDRVEHFGSRTRRNIRALGIVVSKMRAHTLLHNEMLRRCANDFVARRYPTIFQTVIPESTRIAEAANIMVPVNTLQQKYGNGGPYDELSALTREYLAYAEK